MDDFERELKQGFLEEATQLLTDAERCFLALETNPEDAAVTDQLFRLAHNLKGSGKAVGFSALGDFTHKLESFLLKIKNREISIDRAIVNLLLQCNDHLQGWIAALKIDLEAKVDSTSLLESLEAQLNGTAVPAAPAEPMIEAAAMNVPPAEAFVNEELQAPVVASVAEPPAPAVVVPPPAAKGHVKAPAAAADESIRVSLSRLEKLINYVGEMVILQSVLREQSLGTNPHALRKTIHQLGKVTKEVQDISMSLRMIPLKQTFQKMQRIVRDTSAALGKGINFTIEGEETEVDKTVLESLGDPLVHLIRNAVDHGIESAERREASGKQLQGTVKLSAYHQSGNLIIEVRDDGAGLDAAKLRAKAIEKGILRADANLSEKECHHLVFAPGFSTKQEVTDVSGRGVGMDAVKTNIEALQGDVQIETQLGQGTCFKIRLPLTLAIIDGMIIRTAGERYVVPLSHVHETVRPTASDIHSTTGIGEIFGLRGENLPLFRLSTLLGKKNAERSIADSVAIVIRQHGQAIAVLVDEIVGQAQVVIKQLGSEHRDLRGFSGSAILGDGRPALILELQELTFRGGVGASRGKAGTSNQAQRSAA